MQKSCKILATMLAAVVAVCLALGIYFLLPNSAAVYAEETDTETIVNHTSGDDHSTTDGIKWTNLNTDYSTGGTISDSGNYYLSDNITGTITIPSDTSVYLCLNGKIIDSGISTLTVITVEENATLYLCDCKDGEVSNTVRSGKTYNSGVITGGFARSGAVIYVSCTLYM